MISRLRPLAPIGLMALVVSGCGDLFSPGPLSYAKSDAMAVDLLDKPKLQAAVTRSVESLFGPTPDKIVVPKDSGLFDGGRRLAGEFVFEGKSASYPDHPAGGYALYRKHCLHCHGVSGDGNGPTAPFLFPRPRDYRKGVYKFTSTTGNKPSRDDLRRTLIHGLEGTSMPAFEATMNPDEIEQVIDYVVFLDARGVVERQLISEASGSDDKDAETAITTETAEGVAQAVFQQWKEAEEQVLNASTGRVPNTVESILRGRDLFLGRTPEKLECWGCHGAKALGNGPSFVDQRLFDEIVFWGKGPEKRDAYNATALFDLIVSKAGEDGGVARKDLPGSIAPAKGFGSMTMVEVAPLLETLVNRKYVGLVGSDRVKPLVRPDFNPLVAIRAEREAWQKSLDDWENPLRPANLNVGIYKGGRRPIDLYWRIAKGVNGAKMPGHLQLFPDHPERLWDLVNFVLALPHQPELLKDATPPPAPPSTAGASPSTTARR